MGMITQTELRSAGHECLSALLNESCDGLLRLTPEYVITTEQAVGAGILAALLCIAEDLSKLVGIQNATLTMEGHRCK